MRAIRVEQFGGPEVLVERELPDPQPGAGELLVRIEAVGVNFIDTYFRSGLYPRELPFTLGQEAAGVVVAVGPDQPEGIVFSPGDRVAWSDGGSGGYATEAIVKTARAVAVPDGLSPEVAASALLQGMTAHYLAHSTYPIRSGDTVLVHAGAGGVGLLLTQMAVAAGGRVITTVSTDDKEKLSREAGASDVLRYGPDLADRVRELTDGIGVNAVYDGVGAPTFDASLASLKVRGTLALYGAAGGPVPPVDPQRLNAAGSVYLTRPTLANYTADRAELEERANDVLTAIVEGRLQLRVGETYPLADAARAHTDLQARRTTGSVVLVP
ncbi:quinone oxidoreductase family protein [Millisia brevis]|uniref:quinone oxidoreductase family protein n=1 Tax=Millisia brevis TaxID=264148 RepID=UPI00082D7B96|nr:quinone oxidoreductase [Millisia brevis]